MDTEPRDKDVPLDARVAYQVAANLYMQENSVTWARFNAMVATNSIVVAAIGVTANNPHGVHLLPLLLPPFGFVLCCIWLAIMYRGFAYLDVWRDSAYRIERSYLKSVTQALHSGEELSRFGQVAVEVESRGRAPLRQAPPGRARGYASAIIVLFMLLYAAAFAQALAMAPDNLWTVLVQTFSKASKNLP